MLLHRDLALLENRLGHTFADRSVLELALTHSSLGGKAADSNNERLEFLGDRVLGLCVADMLFRAHPGDDEGLMSRRHAALVCASSLAFVARRLELGSWIRMSGGEDKSGGRRREGLLADTMEAVIAALYLDGGIEVARRLIEREFDEEINIIRTKDAKTLLQEYLQGRGEPLPVYEDVGYEGEAHDRVFTVKVSTENFGYAYGDGSSKQSAQRSAAQALLAQLGIDL